MAILKKLEGNELYLYMNGKLIYKRWIDTGQSKVFDVSAYDKYTLTSIKELEYDNSGDLLTIQAKIKLKTTEEGGRKTGFISGYRPHHVFEKKDGIPDLFNTYIGDISFDGKPTIDPGEERLVTVRFLHCQPIERYLYKGQIWWIYEGSSEVGEAEIL